MGERALAAIPCKEEFLLYQSQWGGRRNTLESVFRSANPVDELLDLEWRYLTRCTATEIADIVDFQTTELVYLLTPQGVDVFLPLWFGLATSEQPHPGLGVLVPACSLEAVQRYREALRQFKGLILDAVRLDGFSRTTAMELLERTWVLVKIIVCSVSPCREYL